MGIITDIYGDIKTVDDLKERMKDSSFFSGYLENLGTFVTVCFSADDTIFYNKDQATVVGLMTRITKYYGETVQYYEEQKGDMILLIFRTIYESFVTMKYLIKKGEESQRHFRLISFKNRYREIDFLENLGGNNSNILAQKFREEIEWDCFSISDFEEENKKNKSVRWKLDGKTFKDIQKEVDIEEAYKYAYGIISDMVHGGWGEISQLHLTQYAGHKYRPKLDFYSEMEIKMMSTQVSILIESIQKYSQWHDTIYHDKSPLCYDKDSLNEFYKIHKLMIQLIEPTTLD